MTETVSNWQKLRRLSGAQWAVILQSPWAMLLNGYRLRRRGFRATLELARPGRDSALLPEQQLSAAQDVAHALAIAVKFGPWHPRCLLRSLVLGWFLGRRGIPFDLRIGVPAGESGATATDRDFSAHAWVEHAGIVLNDRADIRSEFHAFE